jgi:hypothetical protein
MAKTLPPWLQGQNKGSPTLVQNLNKQGKPDIQAAAKRRLGKKKHTKGNRPPFVKK